MILYELLGHESGKMSHHNLTSQKMIGNIFLNNGEYNDTLHPMRSQNINVNLTKESQVYLLYKKHKVYIPFKDHRHLFNVGDEVK